MMIPKQNNVIHLPLLSLNKFSSYIVMQTQSAIEAIRSGNQKAVENLYNTHRKPFSAWARKNYGIDDHTISEVYQRSFITFYYNVKEGKLQQMNSSEKTYLFAIGKNLIREHFRIKARQEQSLSVHIDAQEIDYGIMERYEESHRKEKVNRLLSQIGEPCNTVLKLYYFQNLNMKEIAKKMDYKTEQIAAKRKFICLKQLRSLMNLTEM